MQFRITTDPIDPDALKRDHPEAGGYVVFEGRVRNHNEAKDVGSLEYEAYEDLAEREGQKILDEAQTRFDVVDVQCTHRIGHLQVGDVAVAVVAAAAHREAAFAACRYVIDETKRRVPIWKKEHYSEGPSDWIGQHSEPLTESSFYARQKKVVDQDRLKQARVLVVGAGGLGCPALLYLGAAGVGTIGIAETDRLDVSNLHRQVLYAANDVGKLKAELAADKLRGQNPFIEVKVHHEGVRPENAEELMGQYDVVLDCTDNFRTKFLLNDAAILTGTPLVQASIYQFEGQIQVIAPGGPCLRCAWPETPEEGCVGACADVGVLGVVPGLLGTMQAAEAVKLILEIGEPLTDTLLLVDLLTSETTRIRRKKDATCPVCGEGARAALEQAPDWEVTTFEPGEYDVIDIREQEEVLFQPLAGSRHIPMRSLRPSDLRGRTLLVCQHGVRSAHLTLALREQGYLDVYSLAGGVARL